jgi:predicted porin
MKLVQSKRRHRGLWIAALMIGGWAMPAAAADLGGDCCADLEERVAELEATTARKGNRKVSLTVSGWINESVMWWDDGSESNVYVGTNPVEQSRVRFVGEAKVTPDVSAGYTLEFGIFGASSNSWDQNTPDGTTPNSVSVRKSSWYLKSKSLGKVTVGQDGTATYHLLDDADTTMTRNFYDGEASAIYARPFLLRDATGAPIGSLRWSDALRGFFNSTPGDNGRRNIVRYDTPTFAGFSIAASWGEDDLWDMAVIYKGELGDFDLNARAGYGQSTDGVSAPCHGSATAPDNALDCEWWGVSAFLQHKPTGLFVFAGYGDQRDGSKNPGIDAAILDKDSHAWFVQGGIEKKFFPLGKTNFFGQYRRDDAGSNVSGTGAVRTEGAEINTWAIGAAQNLEAAEATLYLVYQHVDGEVTVGTNTTATELSAMQQVIGGMKINF